MVQPIDNNFSMLNVTMKQLKALAGIKKMQQLTQSSDWFMEVVIMPVEQSSVATT